MDNKKLGTDTILMHFGEKRDEYWGAASPPIYQTSLFTYPSCQQFIDGSQLESDNRERYHYTRYGNPTIEILEAKLAALEHGDRAIALSSGMGAITTAVLSCAKAGGHAIVVETVYNHVVPLMERLEKGFGMSISYVSGTDVADFEAAIRPETCFIYLESPSFFICHLQDLEAIAAIAKPKGITTICDSTWATPLFLNPLDLGIDIVIHSMTKYISGHSDLIAGVIVGKGEHMKTLAYPESALVGATIDPFAAWLILRGLRTLPVRLERQQKSGLEIAHFLEEHPAVLKVYHPGLPSHPQHELAKRQLRGYSGVFSIMLKDNSQEATFRFIDALNIFSIGVSWGGFESLSVPKLFHDMKGTNDGWITRLSIGLENVEDLIADLDQALKV